MTDAQIIINYVLEGMEPIEQWPIDFQVILGDCIELLGIKNNPQYIKVKEVSAAPYLRQAVEQNYSSGDERAQPEYQAKLTTFVRGGGKMPPIIIRGNKLIDGRHRLIAQPETETVRAIDLDDLGISMNEA